MSFTLQDVLSRLRGIRRCGSGYMAFCPAHNDRNTRSLSVREGRDGRVLIHCFANCTYRQIVEALGLAPQAAPIPVVSASRPVRQPDDAGRIEAARRLWRETEPLAGTPAQHYLESRGIHLANWPLALRFHPACPHPAGSRLPALVAAVAVHREARLRLAAVHRIYITHDGHKADVEPRKASLGNVKGCAVWLTRPTSQLIITEGIEDAAALMTANCGDSRFADWSYAAAVSAGNLPHVELPVAVRTVIIAADNDEAGRKAANEAACRFLREGRDGRIAYPPEGFKDFNEALLATRREAQELTAAHEP
jgi:putative DNA primase/helicase